MSQLFANVLRTSRYASQRTAMPFTVTIEPSSGIYWVKGGPGEQYAMVDLEFFTKRNQRFEPVDPMAGNTSALLTRALALLGDPQVECDSQYLSDIAAQLREHAQLISTAAERNARAEAQSW